MYKKNLNIIKYIMCSTIQANGYKPAPLDLSAIELTPKMEELVCVKVYLSANQCNILSQYFLSRSTCWLKIRTTCGPRSGSGKVELSCFSTYSQVALLRTLLFSSGWTYGLNEDSERRRSPHLLPYVYVDEAIKVANRNTAILTIIIIIIRWQTGTRPARR